MADSAVSGARSGGQALFAPLKASSPTRYHVSGLRRRLPPKPKLTVADRLLFGWLYRLFPSVLAAIAIVQPETIIRWHRTGFRLYWRWKSRSRGGRPKVPLEIQRLIREMSLANRLWGAPRIHGAVTILQTATVLRSLRERI